MFQKGKAAEWRPAGPRGEVPRNGFDNRASCQTAAVGDMGPGSRRSCDLDLPRGRRWLRREQGWPRGGKEAGVINSAKMPPDPEGQRRS
jgi:hypothetical protein